MNYLVCMLMIGLVIAAFLRILSHLERGNWPSERAHTVGTAVRELLLGRKSA